MVSSLYSESCGSDFLCMFKLTIHQMKTPKSLQGVGDRKVNSQWGVTSSIDTRLPYLITPSTKTIQARKSLLQTVTVLGSSAYGRFEHCMAFPACAGVLWARNVTTSFNGEGMVRGDE
jgi:hypothetical protein